MSPTERDKQPSPEYRYEQPPQADSPPAEESTKEELLERVLDETLDSGKGEAYFPLIVRFACRNRGGSITQPQLAAELIHEILDYRFASTALPVNCHHWIADQLLNDDTARARLVDLWQNALSKCDDVGL